jgi:phosphatidate phosphatase LPIN
MSSFEKLSSTLGFSSRTNNVNAYQRSPTPSSSSSYADSDEEDGEEGGIGPDGQPRKRVRRRSMASMPGTLDEMHFGMDDDDEEEEDIEDHEDDDSHFVHGEEEGDEVYDAEVDDDDVVEEDAEEAFDDDLLAAGEMQKVPFL